MYFFKRDKDFYHYTAFKDLPIGSFFVDADGDYIIYIKISDTLTYNFDAEEFYVPDESDLFIKMINIKKEYEERWAEPEPDFFDEYKNGIVFYLPEYEGCYLKVSDTQYFGLEDNILREVKEDEPFQIILGDLDVTYDLEIEK